MTISKKLASRAAVPALALVLLGGCATPSGGTAFEVEGQRTSLADVQASTEGCVKASEGTVTADGIRAQVAQMLLGGRLAQAGASKSGIEITPAERSEAVKKLQGEALLGDAECTKAVNGFADFAVFVQEVGEKKAQETIKGLAVQVNPRYGQWNAEKGTFTGESGSLSRQDLGLGKVFGR